MNIEAAKLFLGKDVKIYPGDTYRKTGTVVAVDDNGITFKVLSYDGSDSQWVVGKMIFISYSVKIIISEI